MDLREGQAGLRGWLGGGPVCSPSGVVSRQPGEDVTLSESGLLNCQACWPLGQPNESRDLFPRNPRRLPNKNLQVGS